MKISYRSHGSGPVVVFLHGYAGSVLHWDDVVGELQGDFTCVVVNYSHFYLGRESISFSKQVDLLGNWIKTQFPHQVVSIVGMSYGAALSWGIASQFPELINRLIFINPMPPAPISHFGLSGMKLFFMLPLSRKFMVFFLSTFLGRQFLARCARIFRLQTESHVKRLSNLSGKKILFVGHLFNNFAWILKNENWERWEKAVMNLPFKSLLLFDDRDPLFKRPAYSNFNDLLRCSEKVIIRGAGHIATSGVPIFISQRIRVFLGGQMNAITIKRAA